MNRINWIGVALATLCITAGIWGMQYDAMPLLAVVFGVIMLYNCYD